MARPIDAATTGPTMGGGGSLSLGGRVSGFLLERLGLATSLALLAALFMPLPLAMFTVRAFRDLGPPAFVDAEATESATTA